MPFIHPSTILFKAIPGLGVAPTGAAAASSSASKDAKKEAMWWQHQHKKTPIRNRGDTFQFTFASEVQRMLPLLLPRSKAVFIFVDMQVQGG